MRAFEFDHTSVFPALSAAFAPTIFERRLMHSMMPVGSGPMLSYL